MKLFGQRWQFQVGNSIVFADNAFSWTMWAQERFIVNGEVVESTQGYFRRRSSAKVPWLSSLEDSTLEVRLVSAAAGIAGSAFLDGHGLMPVSILVTKWSGGRGSWPEEDAWRDDVPLDFVAFLPGQKEAISVSRIAG